MVPDPKLPDKFFLYRKSDQSLREVTVARRARQCIGVRLGPIVEPESDMGRSLLAKIHSIA
jgi:hypothetical protein